MSLLEAGLHFTVDNAPTATYRIVLISHQAILLTASFILKYCTSCIKCCGNTSNRRHDIYIHLDRLRAPNVCHLFT